MLMMEKLSEKASQFMYIFFFVLFNFLFVCLLFFFLIAISRTYF